MATNNEHPTRPARPPSPARPSPEPPSSPPAPPRIVIGNQTSYLLGRVIARQEADFTSHGGIRERMHAARTAARGATWPTALHGFLAEARSPEDLATRQAELRRETERIARNISRDRGWLP